MLTWGNIYGYMILGVFVWLEKKEKRQKVGPMTL